MLLVKRHPLQEELTVAGLPLMCQLRRSPRKSLALHVRHDAIEVRAPLHTSTADVLRFLDKHQRWVQKKVIEKKQRATEMLSLADGGQVFYKARSLRVRHEHSAVSSVSFDGDCIVIRAPGINTAKAEQVFRQWLLDQARAWLPARTQALAEYLNVGHKLRDVVFRKTRSKWGHCTAGGRIQYNWLIMLAPDGVIDYMISHEVCHLLHMNHSAVYWQSVAGVCPDYQRYVGWLKQNEHRLWF